MNIFKAIYCRTYQAALRCVMPFMPWRQPKVLSDFAALVDELSAQHKLCALVVTDPVVSKLPMTGELLAALIGRGIKAVVYDRTVANPTLRNVGEAERLYRECGCDCIVALGGGSPIDCAKAVGARIARPNWDVRQMAGLLKVRKKLPTLAAIPTTAGTGSEVTVAAVVTDEQTHRKFAITDFNLVPSYAVLDSRLTAGMPPRLTAATGLDALTHAIEAYIGRSTTRRTRSYALKAVRLIFDNLQRACVDGADLDARDNMLQASYLAGLAFTRSYVGYVHAIAHALGARYNIAHGEANAIALPAVLQAYGGKADRKLRTIAVAAGVADDSVTAAQGAQMLLSALRDMQRKLGIANTVAQLRAGDVPLLARLAEREANPLYPVPKLLGVEQIEQILRSLLPDSDQTIPE